MCNKVIIRPITSKDTNNILEWRNSNVVMQNFINRTPLTKEQHEDWLQNKVKRKEVYQFVAEDIDNNISFGSTYFKNIDIKNRKAELGIFIGNKTFRGGVMVVK